MHVHNGRQVIIIMNRFSQRHEVVTYNGRYFTAEQMMLFQHHFSNDLFQLACSHSSSSRLDWAQFTNILTTILLSYYNLTIMPMLRSTYDGRLISKHLTKKNENLLGMIHSQNCRIARDSVRKLGSDIPHRNFSML